VAVAATWLAGVGLSIAQPAAASPAAPVPDIKVPGGAAAFAGIVGLSPEMPRARILPTAIRVLWEAPEGADPAADRQRARVLGYLRQLAATERARARTAEVPAAGDAGDTVPGLLPPATWLAILPGESDWNGCLFAAIVGTRRGALLYHGLAAVDERTRAFLAGHADLLKELIADKRVGIFATLGGSLRIDNGRLVVPGGANAVPLWEAAVDERSTDLPAFVARLYARDSGRLALLYDGVAHLEPAAQRFALSLDVPAAGGQRVDRFRAFCDAAGEALGRWKPADRPFERSPYDAVHLLLSTPFTHEGQPAGPSWPTLWESVFASFLDADEEAVLGKLVVPAADRFDAAELVKRVAVGDAVARRERAETWFFAARVFPRVERRAARDLLVVLRGVSRFPTLAQTLERLGIATPSTYVAAVRVARHLSSADRRLWQFQAALAILERARASRAVDRPTTEALVLSLCAAMPSEGDVRGAVARWLDREFLKAVPPPVVPAGLPTADRALEVNLLAAMAGAVSSPAHAALAALPAIEWEGLRYRLDPAGSTLRRLVAIRQKQGGRALDPVLQLSRLAAAVEGAASAGAAKSAAAGLPVIIDALKRARDETPLALDGGEPSLDELVKDTAERVAKLKPTPDRKALSRVARPLDEAVDWYLTDVLGAIAYAPHVGEPDGPALLGGDPSRLHDFRFLKAGTELGARGAWELPVEARSGRGWHLSGSLLGLDLALGHLGLRRVPRETLPVPPRLSEAVRLAFTESALFSNPFDLAAADVTGRAVREAVARGRARVSALHAGSAAVAAVVVDSGLDEWREQAVGWTLAHEADRVLAFFSAGELARLGGLDTDRALLDSWGTSGWSRDGAPASSFPRRQPWTTMAGRRGVRAVGALVPDLTLGMAETLASLGLPGALTSGVLLVATQDFIDTLRTAHEDDWQEMVAHAQAIAHSPVEDYVAGLTVTGPLVPDETETQHDRQEQRMAARRH
jgi:hypothetical protein